MEDEIADRIELSDLIDGVDFEEGDSFALVDVKSDPGVIAAEEGSEKQYVTEEIQGMTALDENYYNNIAQAASEMKFLGKMINRDERLKEGHVGESASQAVKGSKPEQF